MEKIQWGSLLFSALLGSVSILVTMYILLPGLGMPKLDFAAVPGGWVGATGRYAKVVGVGVFLAGGIGWAFLYATLWPWQGLLGGLLFSLIPFSVSLLSVLPALNEVHVLLHPMPGFLWMKLGGPNSVAANLIQHLIFGLVLGNLYK